MRDFFIRGFEMIVNIIVVVMLIGVVVAAGAMAFGPPMQPGMPGGIGMGIMVLVLGLLYVVFIGGLMFLGLGIYQNTKKTAELLERKGG